MYHMFLEKSICPIIDFPKKKVLALSARGRKKVLALSSRRRKKVLAPLRHARPYILYFLTGPLFAQRKVIQKIAMTSI